MNAARREILKLAMIGGAVAACQPALAGVVGEVGGKLDYSSPEARLRCFLLMRAALDDRINISWAKARYFGVVGDEMRPMFGVVSCVFTRARPIADDEFELVTREIAYFTDHDGAQVIHSYDNPYIGQTVTIPEGGYPPASLILSGDLSQRFAKERPGLEIDHRVAPIHITGDQVWMTETMRTSVAIPGAPSPFRYSDLSAYHGSRAAIEDPSAMQVPALVGYSNVVSWRPWLAMPTGHPGHLSAFGSGRTGSPLADVPQAWLAEAELRVPEILAAPESALEPIWSA